MRINREQLLNQLESVMPGLSTREIIEQSSCFVFEDNTVHTFNDEIACSKETDLSIKGAVQAIPLINLLRKLQEETLEITVHKGKLLIKGKKRRAGIRLEEKILLDMETWESPKKWSAIAENLVDAVSMVQHCAGNDESQFVSTCIHIHPDWIEACDNFQAGRYIIETGIKESVLIRKDSLKHIISMNMTKFSETKSWIHFKNPDELILSCRRFVEEYPDITSVLEVKGSPILLPKGLKEAAEKAEIFSSENVEDNEVKIHLENGKVKIKGEGVSGWYSEIKKAKYNGPPITFTISPKLLTELVERHNKCRISKDKLKAKVGKFSYVTVLGEVKKEED